MDKNLYIKALHFLKVRPRSEKEVFDNLIKKGGIQEKIEEVLVKLREQKFVNDEDFTRWWITSRSGFKPRGWKLIALELREKGISQELMQKVRETLQVEEAIPLEKEKAVGLVKKKIKRYAGLPRQEIYQKLVGFLSRKGFDWDTIKASIDEILPKSV